jgi:hypothetical protein
VVRAVWMFVAKIGILSQRHLHRQQGIAHAGDAAARIGVNLFEGLAKQTLARRDSGHVPNHPIRRPRVQCSRSEFVPAMTNLPTGMSVSFAAPVTPLPIEVHSRVWAIWGHYTRHDDDLTRRNSSRKRDELLLTGSSRPRPGGRVVAAMSASLAGQLRIRS